MNDDDLMAHERPHLVYRVFDAQDRLLYIGCTRDLGGRMAVHRAWGNQSVASFNIKLYGERVESVEFPDLATAHAAEIAAIASEAPWFNREHNVSRFRKVGRDYVALTEPYEPVRPPVNTELLDVMAKFTAERKSA